jgi:hypothetical protein
LNKRTLSEIVEDWVHAYKRPYISIDSRLEALLVLFKTIKNEGYGREDIPASFKKTVMEHCLPSKFKNNEKKKNWHLIVDRDYMFAFGEAYAQPLAEVASIEGSLKKSQEEFKKTKPKEQNKTSENFIDPVPPSDKKIEEIKRLLNWNFEPTDDDLF